jgi:hypothetical protein
VFLHTLLDSGFTPLHRFLAVFFRDAAYHWDIISQITPHSIDLFSSIFPRPNIDVAKRKISAHDKISQIMRAAPPCAVGVRYVNILVGVLFPVKINLGANSPDEQIKTHRLTIESARIRAFLNVLVFTPTL